MSILDRIILTLYMVAMVLVSLVVIVLPFNIIPMDIIDAVKNQLYSNWYYGLIGIAMLVVSLRLLISGISTGKSRKSIIKHGEFGDIKISMETFESLSLRAVKQIAGVKDIKVRIDIVNGDLLVYVKILIIPDVNIPNVVNEVQGKIKSYIESMTDISVKEVKVAVDNLASTSVARVD